MLFKTGKNTFQEVEIKFFSEGKLSDDKSEELFYEAKEDFEKDGDIYIAQFLDYKRFVDYWKAHVDTFNNVGISDELGKARNTDDAWVLYVNGREFRGF